MKIHAVSKGVVLYFLLIFGTMTIFNFNGYSIDEQMFTLILLGIIILIGFYTGKKSGEHAGLNGFLIGVLSSAFLIFYISPYNDMRWDLNFFIMIVWITVSTVSAYVGGKIDVFTKSFKMPGKKEISN